MNNTKTIRYQNEDGWSPEMPLDVFLKEAPSIQNMSSIVVSEVVTLEEAKLLGYKPNK